MAALPLCWNVIGHSDGRNLSPGHIVRTDPQARHHDAGMMAGRRITLVPTGVYNVVLRQCFDYGSYPLDRQNVWLRMWQPDFAEDAVLVPDFSSYPPWHDQQMLATDPEMATGEWRARYTAYSYARHGYTSSFGLGAYDRPVDYPDLYFNMVYERTRTGEVVGSLMPAALITLVVFASLFVCTRERLGAFGSNLFAVIACLMTILLVLVVKRNAVRDISADGAVMYLEYVYFGIYLLLLLATANALLIALAPPGSAFPAWGHLVARVLYWPLYAGLMLAATIGVFFS
ncbi:hypothetical protein [Streptomyces sp. 4F14]|uniref:hypothetical protein n=1 Tax=Streptomyces sp. 4F14 TaxID=3394380 RepID=UPI003A86D85D